MDSHFFITYGQYITLVCESKAAYLLRNLTSHLSRNIRNSIKLLESQKYFEFKTDCQLIEYVSSRDSSEPLGCSLPALRTDLLSESSDFFWRSHKISYFETRTYLLSVAFDDNPNSS